VYVSRAAEEVLVLASLLPGLRDVRTPLTVGYLYLLVLWVWAGDHIPRERPAEDGFVASLFELADIFGPAAALGALSFVAYVLGALLTLSVERGRSQRHLDRWSLGTSVDGRQTFTQLDDLLRGTSSQILDMAHGLAEDDFDALERDMNTAESASPADLRIRLLVANQEMYGEYDRLSAEAEFRLNVCPPLLLLGVTAVLQVSLWWLLVTVLTVSLLAYQGLSRRAEARAAIFRAVLSGVIEHPLQTLRARWG
jgi:hypothetical protein